VTGYIDWCLVLSATGGPKPYDNFNSASVLVDAEADAVLYTPLYYLLGHFSKFIRPGAFRLGVGGDLPAGIHATAAGNPDGSTVVVIFNDNPESRAYVVNVDGETISCVIAGDAVQTVSRSN